MVMYGSIGEEQPHVPGRKPRTVLAVVVAIAACAFIAVAYQLNQVPTARLVGLALASSFSYAGERGCWVLCRRA